mgnify:CR=1 FL=1|jgi:hypothetical protein
MVRRSLDFDERFSNGTFIFDARGMQISPSSPEGRVIEETLAKQKVTKKENKTQKQKVEKLINKDIDGDGVIGAYT